MRKADRNDWLMAAVILAGALAITLSLTSPAWADCPKFEDVRKLVDKHKEQPVASAVTAVGTTLIFFVHSEKATWTAIEIRPSDGCARIFAFGEAWQQITPRPTGEDS